MQKRIDMIGLLLSSPTSGPMKVLIVLAVLGSPFSMGQQQATAAVAYQWSGLWAAAAAEIPSSINLGA